MSLRSKAKQFGGWVKENKKILGTVAVAVGGLAIGMGAGVGIASIAKKGLTLGKNKLSKAGKDAAQKVKTFSKSEKPSDVFKDVSFDTDDVVTDSTGGVNPKYLIFGGLAVLLLLFRKKIF